MLVVARLLGGTGALFSGGGFWSLPAFVAHDAFVALAFWAVDRVTRRPKWLWIGYAAIVLLAAINVPIVRALGVSLTMPMLRAARGPLLDSIRAHVTPTNLLALVLVVLAAALLPRLLSRASARMRLAALVCGVVLLALAPMAFARVPTVGRERNVITALGSALWPRLASRDSADGTNWRVSPFGMRAAPSRTDYRHAGTGFNVVLIVLESTAAQYLAPYGAADDPMPAVSALAARSLVIADAYASYPESIRALYSLGCAKSPAFDVSAEQLAAAACDALPVQLARAGYRTALYHSGRFAYLGMTETLATLQFETMVDAGGIGGRVESSFGVDEPSTVTKMFEWIDQGDPARPFFLTYLPTAGHHPYASSGAGPFGTGDDLSAYKNAIHEGDAAIATFLAGLRERGLDSRTVVIVTGDHGEAFGQHSGNFAHSFFIYDENIRVPLIIHVPGRPAGRLNRVASLVDVAPTLLDILGAPPLSGAEGASLLDGPERLALFFTDYAVGWLGLRDGCLKYSFEVGSRRSYLYNACDDPFETVNLAERSHDRVEAYRNHVERWAAARRAAVLGTAAHTTPEPAKRR